MKPDFEYQTVPYRFPHCLNEQCLRADRCLHRLAGRFVPSDVATFVVINPSTLPADGEGCPHFMPNTPVRYARGMVHLLDHVPHAIAKEIKCDLQGYFGRVQYYRIAKGSRLITPEEQSYIKKLFKRFEVDGEPVFDEYVDSYRW